MKTNNVNYSGILLEEAAVNDGYSYGILKNAANPKEITFMCVRIDVSLSALLACPLVKGTSYRVNGSLRHDDSTYERIVIDVDHLEIIGDKQ